MMITGHENYIALSKTLATKKILRYMNNRGNWQSKKGENLKIKENQTWISNLAVRRRSTFLRVSSKGV